MRTFTPGQFATYLKTLYDRTFIYDSRNQPGASGCTMFLQRYDFAQVFLLPATLVLKNGNGVLCFSTIKRVIVDDSEPAIGYVITIECISESGCLQRHVIVADRCSPLSASAASQVMSHPQKSQFLRKQAGYAASNRKSIHWSLRCM